jgi:metal-responsive CopG/Arc/MetJ family transcriptional regulator
MRTIVDIPDTQINTLDQLAKKKKISRAELVRQALSNYITGCIKTNNGYKSAFGSWQNNDLKDSICYQKELRDEWD